MCDGINLFLDALVSPGIGPFFPGGKSQFCFRLCCPGSIFKRVNLVWMTALSQLRPTRPDLALSLTKIIEGNFGKSMELQQPGQEGRGLRWVRHQVCVKYWGIRDWFRLSSSSLDLYSLSVWHHRACRQCWNSAFPFLQISHAGVMSLCLFIHLTALFALDLMQSFHPFHELKASCILRGDLQFPLSLHLQKWWEALEAR